MIKFGKEFYRKEFHGKNTKEAYLKACKWYAVYVIANSKLASVQVEYIKAPNKITMVLYSVLDNLEEVKKKHCAACTSMHKSFFINESTNCNKCSMAGYQRRLEQMNIVKAGFYKEILNKRIEEKGKEK